MNKFDVFIDFITNSDILPLADSWGNRLYISLSEGFDFLRTALSVSPNFHYYDTEGCLGNIELSTDEMLYCIDLLQ